ncbi:MAG: hypothetical protein ACYDA0_06255 [Candidatus Dormibacteraceae bacterium]
MRNCFGVRRLWPSGCRWLALQADVFRGGRGPGYGGLHRVEFGTVDVLINNAGLERSTPVLVIDEAKWDRLLAAF